MREVSQWQKKSRIKWAGVEDMPSTFFFQAMNARRKRETMASILLDDNTYIIDEKAIMAELVRFYKKLFSKEVGFEEYQPPALQQLLYHTKSTLSPSKIRALEKKPTKAS